VKTRCSSLFSSPKTPFFPALPPRGASMVHVPWNPSAYIVTWGAISTLIQAAQILRFFSSAYPLSRCLGGGAVGPLLYGSGLGTLSVGLKALAWSIDPRGFLFFAYDCVFLLLVLCKPFLSQKRTKCGPFLYGPFLPLFFFLDSFFKKLVSSFFSPYRYYARAPGFDSPP